MFRTLKNLVNHVNPVKKVPRYVGAKFIVNEIPFLTQTHLPDGGRLTRSAPAVLARCKRLRCMCAACADFLD